MKRGGGRRYYRPLDVELLKGIRHLLYDQGYTIKGVQRLLRENNAQFIIALGNGDVQAIARPLRARSRSQRKNAPPREAADNEMALPSGIKALRSRPAKLFRAVEGR